jgi:ankyrin repeat protein
VGCLVIKQLYNYLVDEEEEDNYRDHNKYSLFAELLGLHSDTIDVSIAICHPIGTLLMAACYGTRNMAIIQLLFTLYNAARTINMIYNKYTALHFAVRDNTYVSVKHIVYKRNHNRRRNWCCWRRHQNTVELVKLLLQNGANVNIKSTCHLGMTPFHLSIINDMDITILLHDYVDDINVCDSEGHTPLYWAICDDNVPAVQLLLSHPKIDLTLER